MIAYLSERNSVTVASLARSEEERDAAAGLSDYCERVVCEVVRDLPAYIRTVMGALVGRPFSMGYFFSPRLKTRIDRLLTETSFDLIFVHCSSVAQYVEDIQGIPKILDFGDMDSQKWQLYAQVRRFPMTLAYAYEGWRLEQAERRLAAKFDRSTCTTRQELETLDSFSTAQTTSWFPNGVDIDYFGPAADYDHDLISFIGRMDYYPNQECVMRFCEESWPRIRNKRPTARFVIVGAEPPPVIRRLRQIPGVEVTGSVEDVRPFVSRSAVNVATLSIARGTQNKILEAMAMGVPVVASSLAAKGVDAEPGRHLLCADNGADVADAVLSLLEDPAMRARLADAGRERIKSHHNWKNSMRLLSEIVDEVAAGSHLQKGTRKAMGSI